MLRTRDRDGVRIDGWQNVTTGLGTALDKVRNLGIYRTADDNDDNLETLYHEDAMASRIVDAIPDQAFAGGINITTSDDIDADVARQRKTEIEEELGRLHAHECLLRAASAGRLFGFGAVMLGIEDGRLPSEPVNENTIRSILFASNIDKRDVSVHSWYTDPRSEKYWHPEVYLVTRSLAGASVSQYVHESRIIAFGGARTSDRERYRRGGFDHSVLRRVRSELQEFACNWMSVANMMTDSSQSVLKITGLWEILAGGRKQELIDRIEIFNASRYSGRTIPIDTDEEFLFAERGFSGVADVLAMSCLRLSSATGIPMTVLFGRSPAGLNATGESDQKIWYDLVRTWQTYEATSRYDRMIQLVASALSIDNPKSYHVSWPAMDVPTPEAEAALRKSVAETDVIYINAGVLDPDEVATTRFGGQEYSSEAPTIDVASRATPTVVQDAKVDSLDDYRGMIPADMLFDMHSIKTLVNNGADQPVIRRIATRIAQRMGLGTDEVIDAIMSHDFAPLSTKPSVSIEIKVDQQYAQGNMPPAIAIDLAALECFQSFLSPQALIDAIINRINTAIAPSSHLEEESVSTKQSMVAEEGGDVEVREETSQV